MIGGKHPRAVTPRRPSDPPAPSTHGGGVYTRAAVQDDVLYQRGYNEAVDKLAGHFAALAEVQPMPWSRAARQLRATARIIRGFRR